jgi:ribosomal protein S12 methylthiotransferase
MKTYLVSLGCPKNLTDSEVLLGKLAGSGYEITARPAEATLIVVNTCSFVKTTRGEAIGAA